MSWTYHINGQEVTPYNTRDLKISNTLDDVRYKKSLNGDIYLKNNDYTTLKNLERVNKYDKHTFNIKNNGAIEYSGVFRITDCEFDDFRETVIINTVVQDDYVYIKENSDEKINILTLDGDEINIGYKTYLEFHSTYWAPSLGTIYDSYLPEGNNWTLYYKDTEIVFSVFSNDFYLYIYCRERINIPKGQPAPTGTWTSESELSTDDRDTYTREITHFTKPFAAIFHTEKVPGFDSANNTWFNIIKPHSATLTGGDEVAHYPSVSLVYCYVRDIYKGGEIVYYTKFNGYELKSVFNHIVTESMPDFTGSVVSTFLFRDVNCVGENNFYDSQANISTNSVYSLSHNPKYIIPMKRLIKKADNNYTTEKLSFKEITEELNKRMQCKWHIDTSGNIRLEHISYYEKLQTGINITSNNNHINNKYKYLKGDPPNRIIFTENGAGSPGFNSEQIIYGDIPSIEGEQENKKEINLSKLYTDIDYHNLYYDNAPDTGFLLLEYDPATGTILNPIFIFVNIPIQNYKLSINNCIDKYWKHSAYQSSYQFNNETVNVESLKRIKVQNIEFDTTSKIEPNKSIETNIGVGQIKSLERIPGENHYKAEVLYV